MNVVVSDRKYDDLSDPYGDAVRANGGEIRYEDCKTEDDVINNCSDADILVNFKAPITEKVAKELSGINLVVRLGTGFDHINIKACTEHGIPVSNTPGTSRHAIAAHAITLMLAAGREVVYRDQNLRAADGWCDRDPVNLMYGGTFGVVGFGKIGRATVEKARGFDMDVIVYDPYFPADVAESMGVEKVTFDEMLERADCISIHTPLTAETHQMFSTEEFERMKNDAIIVNTARGPIIDEEALVEAIETGEIWAAGLDVFETEPPTDTPAFSCDRIVCSPHNGGRFERGVTTHIELVNEVVVNEMNGHHPEHLVNPWMLQYSDNMLNPEGQSL